MDRFANPQTNYLTLQLAYKDAYPLGWFLSDSLARSISQQAKDSISLKNNQLAATPNAGFGKWGLFKWRSKAGGNPPKPSQFISALA